MNRAVYHPEVNIVPLPWLAIRQKTPRVVSAPKSDVVSRDPLVWAKAPSAPSDRHRKTDIAKDGPLYVKHAAIPDSVAMNIERPYPTTDLATVEIEAVNRILVCVVVGVCRSAFNGIHLQESP